MRNKPYMRLFAALLLIAANSKEFAFLVLMFAGMFRCIAKRGLDFFYAIEIAAHFSFAFGVFRVRSVSAAIHPADDTVFCKLADNFIAEFVPRHGKHGTVSGLNQYLDYPDNKH